MPVINMLESGASKVEVPVIRLEDITYSFRSMIGYGETRTFAIITAVNLLNYSGEEYIFPDKIDGCDIMFYNVGNTTLKPFINIGNIKKIYFTGIVAFYSRYGETNQAFLIDMSNIDTIIANNIIFSTNEIRTCVKMNRLITTGDISRKIVCNTNDNIAKIIRIGELVWNNVGADPYGVQDLFNINYAYEGHLYRKSRVYFNTGVNNVLTAKGTFYTNRLEHCITNCSNFDFCTTNGTAEIVNLYNGVATLNTQHTIFSGVTFFVPDHLVSSYQGNTTWSRYGIKPTSEFFLNGWTGTYESTDGTMEVREDGITITTSTDVHEFTYYDVTTDDSAADRWVKREGGLIDTIYIHTNELDINLNRNEFYGAYSGSGRLYINTPYGQFSKMM